MNTREVLVEQLNEALAKWQNSMTALPDDPQQALDKVISNNRKLAEGLADAITNYTKSVSVQITATTNFGTAGGDTVVPWSTPTYVSLSNPRNHAYIQEDNPSIVQVEIGRLGGKPQYKRILSYPTIIRI